MDISATILAVLLTANVFQAAEAPEELFVHDTCEPTSAITSTEAITSTDQERYLMAKVVKCESGNCSDDVQQAVASSIINRVDDQRFPDTITEVIYSPNQYTPTMLPSWWDKWEPTQKEYDNVDAVLAKGATCTGLYFESCTGTSWHSRNLDLVYDGGKMRFYR